MKTHPKYVIAALLAIYAPIGAQQTVQVQEWTVPWEKSRPRDPAVDPNGIVWFVGQVGNYVANLDPRSGAFKKIEIDSGTYPHNLIIDAQGNAWYSGNRNGRIGRIDAATGKITTYAIPGTPRSDPHTMVFDRKGDIWFTMQSANFVGHLATKTGAIRLIQVPTRNARPYGILMDKNDVPWFVEFGTNKLASINTGAMEINEFTLPHANTRPRRIAMTSDGAIWYGDYMRGTIGRFDPVTHRVKEWAAPSGQTSLPYGMTADDRDRIWIVETGVQPNRLAAFDPKAEAWVYNVPVGKSGGLTVRYMIFHKPTRTIWFGTDANTIARVVVP